MKKIDLHIHTVNTFSDSGFIYSFDTFKRYVKEAKLDAVAVTNHDMFDGVQFKQIAGSLGTTVFPGIEVNVAKGHLLLIADPADLHDFTAKAKKVADRITKIGDTMSVEELVGIFVDLNKYLLIPHADKGPPIQGEALEKLRPHLSAGEVDSAKKFIRAMKDPTKLTPVLFSDARMRADMGPIPMRQTYVDCGAMTLSALKTCLRDRTKVALSQDDGNELFSIFENGQMLSTGLNVLIGSRSSGKTHTLDAICAKIPRTKYVKQFSLVQQNEEADERDFLKNVERRRSAWADQYLSGFKRVLDEVVSIDLVANDRAVQNYVATLLKAAQEAHLNDVYSKVTLFNEVEFEIGKTDELIKLIASVRHVIENTAYRDIIEKHVNFENLKKLAVELIELLWAQTQAIEQRIIVNKIVKEVKGALKLNTSATQVEEIDLYELAVDAKKVERFSEIVGFLKQESVIFEEGLQSYRIEVTSGPFFGAGDIKSASGVKTSFLEAFESYDRPYEYLQKLLDDENLSRAALYKLFAKITYRTLNRDGFEVSGGERSEVKLLQEIADAQNFDILLVDEPESSFDNMFLKSDVCKILKGISATMPVVVVTHNNTIGASIGADYLLYTRKEMEAGKVVYRLYCGYPSDRTLFSVEGKSIKCHASVMESLEAGELTYEDRRRGYEAIKD